VRVRVRTVRFCPQRRAEKRRKSNRRKQMSVYSNVKGYPKTVELKSDLLNYGENRIFKITKEEALSLSKEFKLPTNFKKFYDESEFDFYYLNHRQGERHIILWLPSPAAQKS
jgi:hypothetical protein